MTISLKLFIPDSILLTPFILTAYCISIFFSVKKCPPVTTSEPASAATMFFLKIKLNPLLLVFGLLVLLLHSATVTLKQQTMFFFSPLNLTLYSTLQCCCCSLQTEPAPAKKFFFVSLNLPCFLPWTAPAAVLLLQSADRVEQQQRSFFFGSP